MNLKRLKHLIIVCVACRVHNICDRQHASFLFLFKKKLLNCKFQICNWFDTRLRLISKLAWTWILWNALQYELIYWSVINMDFKNWKCNIIPAASWHRRWGNKIIKWLIHWKKKIIFIAKMESNQPILIDIRKTRSPDFSNGINDYVFFDNKTNHTWIKIQNDFKWHLNNLWIWKHR